MTRLWPLLLVLASSSGHGQVSGNVLSRVFQIRFSGASGTAFVLDHQERQYLVTANHILASAGTEAKIEIFGRGDSQWHTVKVLVLHGKNECADVAVLVPPEDKLVQADPIPHPARFFMGQEAYFLGYPYGLYTSFGKDKGNVPLIKHAHISAVTSCAAIHQAGGTDDRLILLDGLNNPGFSGGPVVAPDLESPGTRGMLRLVGVISGFKNEYVNLNISGKPIKNAATPANTGIIIVIPIEQAVQLIQAYVANQPK